MFEKKPTAYKSPDLTDLQEVIINDKTKLYIAVGADPEEARTRYFSRNDIKNKQLIIPNKKVASV